MGDESGTPQQVERDAAADQLPETDFVGRLIEGRYKVRARVARGGFATVYVATDRRLGRDVVVKVMHPYLAEGQAGAEFVPRFRREARNAARLAHPGTVAIIDQGVEDNLPFLITEYVPGSSVRRELRIFGTLPLGKSLAILDQVLATVAAAHRKGLVHRDLKPENLLIDRDGMIKVADFGLARAVNEVTSEITGAIVGSASYLAPEVFLGIEPDPRTDVYAIGIMGYEMLTGHLPYSSTDPIDVALHHVNDDMPPAAADIDWLPQNVSDLLGHFAARDPSQRPRDGVHALAELRRVRRELDSDYPELLSRRSQPPSDFEEPETGEIDIVTDAAGDAGHGEAPDNPTLPSLGNETLNLDRIPTAVFTPARGVPKVSDDAHDRVFASGSPLTTVSADLPSVMDTAVGLPTFVAVSPDTSDLAAVPAGVDFAAGGQAGATSDVLDGSSSVLAGGSAGRPRFAGKSEAGSPARGSKTGPRTASRAKTHPRVVPLPQSIGRGRQLANRPWALIILGAVLLGGLIWGLRWWQTGGIGDWTTVPADLFGTPENQAVRQLTNRRLNPEIVRQYSSDVPAGLVMATHPEMGARVQRHETVELLVSGSPRLVTIPDGLIGQPIGTVESLLRAAEVWFTPPEREYSDDVPFGEVMALTHEPGIQIPIQTVIGVTVSKGPAPVTVSQQVGRERADSINALAHLGLQVAFTEDQPSDSVPRGYILAQDPPAGTELHRGDTVTLTISAG